MDRGGVTAKVGVVTVCDGDNTEVVYGVPPGVEELKEDDDTMPPRELQEEEVMEQVDERLGELQRDEAVTEEGWRRLRVLLKKKWRVMANKVGGVTKWEHTIDTGDAKPVAQRMHRFSPEQHAEADRQVTEMLKQGLIEESNSEWATSMVLVKKKDGGWRAAIDYRGLNAVTVPDEYPAPRVDTTLDGLQGARVFTMLDIRSGYWQLPLRECDRKKTAFRTRRGLFHWKVMPFGVRNGTASYQRMMATVLQGIRGVLVYIDDVIIGTPDEEGHLGVLEEVLSRLEEAGLVCKLSKCHFMRSKVEVLGFEVSQGRVAMQKKQVERILECEAPKDKKGVRRFVGLCGFYRHFVPGFAEVTAPLTDVMGKTAEWRWEKKQEEAFEELKRRIAGEPVLRLPDFKRPFVVYTDASDVGVGAVLGQVDDDGKAYAVQFMSRKLSDAETRYSTTEQEYLALVHAVRKWKPYLLDGGFTAYTDHKALLGMVARVNEDYSDRVKRWGLEMQRYEFTLKHIEGKANVVADALSREPFIEAKVAAVVVAKDDDEEDEEEVVMPEGESQWAVNNSLGREEVEKYWEEMRVKQRRDPELAEWIKQLEEGWEVKQNRGKLVLEQGVLFKKESGSGVLRMVIPVADRAEILRAVHEDVRTGGHFTAKKAMEKVRPRWWWPNVYQDVEHWVASCRICSASQHVRGLPKAKANRPRVVPNRPWDSVYIDAVGPLPRASNGAEYILVAVDHFTRWAEVKAVRRLTKETFVEWLRQDLIGRWGPMTRLTSDRGSNFVADLSKAMCEAWGVDKRTTTAWRPQANGLVERFNGTLKTLLKEYAEETGRAWHTGIKDYVYAYNTTVHTSTGFTPFHLMHGWEARVPYDLLVEGRGASGFVEVERYRENMVNAIEECWSEARRTMSEKDRVRQWNVATAARMVNGVPTFEVGDMVWLYKPFLSRGESKGVRQLWFGPYEVKEKVPGGMVYVIDKDGVEDTVHVDRLKKYKTLDQSAPQRRYERMLEAEEREREKEGVEEKKGESDGSGKESEGDSDGSGESDDEESESEEDVDEDKRAKEEQEGVYEVEEILDKRTTRESGRLGGRTTVRYLVKWKNWGDEHNSWERLENLEGSMALVEEFEEKRAARGERGRVRARS